MKILGFRYGHDAAAALLIDGKIVADVAEERFTRAKNDGSFPVKAIEYCLKIGGISSADLDVVCFPGQNIHPDFFAFFNAPHIRKKTTHKEKIKKTLKFMGVPVRTQKPVDLPIYIKPFDLSPSCRVVPVRHHLAHAASAYYTSGLNKEKTLVAVFDGIGDGESVTLWRGENNKLKKLASFGASGSLGWFYGVATEGMDWRHGSEEWKLMGLAPYGKTQPGALSAFHPHYKDGELVRPNDYGAPMRFMDHGANHYHFRQAEALREKVKEMGRENYAAEVQRISEEQAMNVLLPWLKKENTRHLCCAGGFFLNVKFNQKLWYTKELDTQWIYPNPGDAGLAVGAALFVSFDDNPDQTHERLENVYTGPEYSNEEIKQILDDRGLAYEEHADIETATAKELAKNHIVGWFQGRMEAGPRALGGRSILMSPLKPENKDVINARVKYREAFRPFCPSMLHESADTYLIDHREEDFMVTSFEVKPEKADKIPAVVHEDGTARPQMVKKHVHPRYHALIKAFGDITGETVILNTSFNVKGEPIINTPREALKCFIDTGLDVLVVGNFMLKKPNID